MPLQDYGRYIGSMAETVQGPVNAFYQAQDRQRQLGQRDQMLQQDASQNAFMQQRYTDQQAQAEDDDAEWDAAYAARDWGAMAKLDPQTAKVLYEFEQAQKPQEPLQEPQVRNQGGYSYMFDPTKGVIPGSVQAPQRAPVGGGGGEGGNVNWQRTTKTLPDGTVQDVAFNPRTLEEKPLGEPKPQAAAKPMSPKDSNTARIKLTQVKVARRQLQDAQAKYAALKDTLSAGPGGNLIPSPKGKAYDAAIDTMRSSISALTRVPGIGAMSDFETRLDQAKFPTRGNYEVVGEQQLQALADQLDTIESSYQEMLGQKPAAEAPQDSADPLAQYEGKTIKQGNKRFTVIRGKGGKLMAVEVK